MSYYQQPTYQEGSYGWGRPPSQTPPTFVPQPTNPYAPSQQPQFQQPGYYNPGYASGMFDPYAQDRPHTGSTAHPLLGPPVLPYGYPATTPQRMHHPSRPVPPMVVIPQSGPPTGPTRPHAPPAQPLTVIAEESAYSSPARSRSRPSVVAHRTHHQHTVHERRRRGRSPSREHGGYSNRRSRSRSKSYSPEPYGLTRDRSPVRAPSDPLITRPLQALLVGGERTMTMDPVKQRNERQRLLSVLPDWMIHPDSTSPPYQFNPLLAGDSHQQTLITVDLRVSSLTFEPKRFTSIGATLGMHAGELSQPATYPGVTEMTITCDKIPQWKIDLKLPTNTFAVEERRRDIPSLTVYDVLFGVQHSIRSHISHEDWGTLSAEQRDTIADAYKQRCRANSETQVFEESQGVRRVDYLLDKHFFKGLVLPKGPDQFKNVKLIVGKK